MNRFRFRLESVLRVREAREDVKKRELGVKMGHLRREEDRMDELEASGRSHDQSREEKGVGRITVRGLMRDFFYARHLEKKQEDQQVLVEQAREDMEGKREELVDASKDKKVLERLKEKKHVEWNKKALKEEQALIDETASQRYNHNR